jgi:hypothetical protein
VLGLSAPELLRNLSVVLHSALTAT